MLKTRTSIQMIINTITANISVYTMERGIIGQYDIINNHNLTVFSLTYDSKDNGITDGALNTL